MQVKQRLFDVCNDKYDTGDGKDITRWDDLDVKFDLNCEQI